MVKGRLEDRVKFTTGHLAQLLQTSRRTISRYIDQGRIRARTTVGGWRMVSREEVINFLWDTGFDRSIPPMIRVTASQAYERMTEPPPLPPPPRAKAQGKKR